MFRVAVIGAGPSGYFVAGEVLKHFPGAAVFMFEKRRQPYGLVRYGVAPDHILTKRAVKTFEQIARQPGFHYADGVEVGRDLALDDVRRAHDAVVVCTGAEHPRRLAIPGAELPGVVAALDLARWANGESSALANASILDGAQRAVIIGNGNVALDAARILARRDEDWEGTDIAGYARAALSRSRLRAITMAGRRGPECASFTRAELQEVISLPDWRVVADQGLPLGLVAPASTAENTISFIFNQTPIAFTGADRVTGVTFSGGFVAADVVIAAIGQRGEALPGLPFDEARGIVPNDRGRVAEHQGVYVCGWIKRGATGLIGHNRKDAIETVARMREDFTPPSP